MLKIGLKQISRRQSITFLSSVLATSLIPSIALSSEERVNDRVLNLSSGKAVDDARIYLEVPEIAENGNAVPISFEIESPMTSDNFVKMVYIMADGNPEPDVAAFNFTPYSGACYATTRMRLSKTQNVHILAAFSDGSFAKANAPVKVTIGGCGG